MKETSPYLIFNGNCREAMTFYQQCIGGELHMQTFGEVGADTTSESRDWLIHARLAKGATVLMSSDNMPGNPFVQGNNVWVSLACESVDEVQSLFSDLSAGGAPMMPPHDAFWGARFAMFSDRFGVNWMLTFERPRPQQPQ